MHDRFQHVQNSLTVSIIQDGELAQTAAMHIEHLGHGLFPRLGLIFMRRWHRTFLLSPYGVAIAIRDTEGQVSGVLLGTTDQSLFMREVLSRHRGPLAWRGAIGLVRKPGLLATFARTRALLYARKLSHRSRPTTPVSATSPRPVAVVHAVITCPAFRRQGVGTLLLSTFEQAVAETGIQVIQLVTQADGGAVEFYQALGWNETARRNDKSGAPIVQFDREVRSA